MHREIKKKKNGILVEIILGNHSSFNKIERLNHLTFRN